MMEIFEDDFGLDFPPGFTQKMPAAPVVSSFVSLPPTSLEAANPSPVLQHDTRASSGKSFSFISFDEHSMNSHKDQQESAVNSSLPKQTKASTKEFLEKEFHSLALPPSFSPPLSPSNISLKMQKASLLYDIFNHKQMINELKIEKERLQERNISKEVIILLERQKHFEADESQKAIIEQLNNELSSLNSEIHYLNESVSYYEKLRNENLIQKDLQNKKEGFLKKLYEEIKLNVPPIQINFPPESGLLFPDYSSKIDDKYNNHDLLKNALSSFIEASDSTLKLNQFEHQLSDEIKYLQDEVDSIQLKIRQTQEDLSMYFDDSERILNESKKEILLFCDKRFEKWKQFQLEISQLEKNVLSSQVRHSFLVNEGKKLDEQIDALMFQLSKFKKR